MIKGYNTNEGYWGWIEEEQNYILFASERDYLDWVED